MEPVPNWAHTCLTEAKIGGKEPAFFQLEAQILGAQIRTLPCTLGPTTLATDWKFISKCQKVKKMKIFDKISRNIESYSNTLF